MQYIHYQNMACHTILIVEDDLINQKLVQTILHNLGYATRIADNGLQAYEIASSGEVCAVLMDIELPLLDGIKTVQRIREYERKNGGHIPIIAMTNYSDKERRQEYLRSGMDGCLSKPFKPFELAEILKNYGI